MPKEWILNSATSRYQLNYKRNVGAVSDEIRRCSPKALEDWRAYYFQNVRSATHLENLGRKLYVKISEVITSEVNEITEDDCIDFIFNLVINRTFDGYQTEVQTIYGYLENSIGYKVKAAPDEWDRKYNVDFFVQVRDKYIGLQIKPVSDVSHITQIYKERDLQLKSHAEFKKRFGGNVYYVFSEKRNGRKIIRNLEVVDEVIAEIKRLAK